MATKLINGITADLSPYFETTFGPSGAPSQFQSGPGTGPSSEIVVTLDRAVSIASVTVYGGSYPGNTVSVYDANGVLLAKKDAPYSDPRIPFGWASAILTFTAGVDFNSAARIKSMRLTPAPADYVAYGNLSFTEGTVPATQTWRNGLTKQIVNGLPPTDWAMGSDGWWYPSTVSPPTEGTQTPTQWADLNPPAPPPPTPTAITSYVTFVVRVNVRVLPQPAENTFVVRMNVKPAIPQLGSDTQQALQQLHIKPIMMSLKDATMEDINRLIDSKIETYFDDDRVLKTVLNFGGDYQALMVNQAYDPNDSSNQSMLVKLYRPLPEEVARQTPVFISRELSLPLIDQIFLVVLPDNSVKVYLRPPNKSVKVAGQSGKSIEKVTLQTLLSSGAFDPVQPSDAVVEEWFTTDIQGAELNIDYSNYKNFVFFGSAEWRLRAFVNKLLLIEDLTSAIAKNSSSIAASGIDVTSSAAYPALYGLGQQKQDIIRSFDGYEQYLYYQSSSIMSGAFVTHPDDNDQWYIHVDATWPKISGSVVPVASASTVYEPISASYPVAPDGYESTWLDAQLRIARAYDSWNINSLFNNMPDYLRNDDKSEEFHRFLHLIGYHFDNIKLYIDKYSDIYDRGSDPNQGLSKDLVWNVANGFGVELPNEYAISDIVNYTIGSGSAQTYRNAAAETWKRFLHNQIFLMKTKGTRTALRTLMNTYGLLPTSITIRESTTPSLFYATESYETIEEQTNTVQFESGSFIKVPWASANNPLAVQIRFSTSVPSGINQVLFNLDNAWALELDPLSGSYYRVIATKAGTTVLSSSYMEIGSGDFYSVMLRYGGAGSGSWLYVKKSDDDGDFVESSVTQEPTAANLTSVWASPTTLYLGGSGSLYGTPFIGLVDEFRIWGEYTTENTYDMWVRYPGMYNGNTETSARDYLWVRMSFNTPKNLGSSSVAERYYPNESPYQRLASSPASMDGFTASFFANEPNYPYSMQVITRTIQRITPSAGGSIYDTNKIIIEPPPVLKYISGSNVPVLSRTNSIVSVQEKDETFSKPNNLVFFAFSPTEAINDSIIRSIGNIDWHDYIGDPGNMYSGSYDLLDQLNEFYWNTYAYRINTNSFITFVKNLLSSMFDQAEDLIPVRAKLLSGIVIEPHILERYKYQNKPVGWETDFSFEADATTTQPTEVLAEYEDNFTILNTAESQEVAGSYDDLSNSLNTTDKYLMAAEQENNEAVLSTTEILLPQAEYTNYLSTIQFIDDFATIRAENDQYEALYSIYENVYVDATETYNKALASGSISSDTAINPVISPNSDIENDIGARTYFDDPNGLVGVFQYNKARNRESVMTSQGTWAMGTVYHRDDYVTQPDTITDSQYSVGNGKEFYAISDNFISNIPPYGDVINWRPVTYTLVQSLEVRKAVLISGSVSLVPPSSPLPPIVGYLPQHYRFFRPNYTAYVRARYTGCMQTQNTTTDGKPPVEIMASAGDTLFVVNPSEPVQPNTNQSGPILDVR